MVARRHPHVGSVSPFVRPVYSDLTPADIDIDAIVADVAKTAKDARKPLRMVGADRGIIERRHDADG